MRVLVIAGSPRYDVDGTDLGWGRSRKTEFVHVYSKYSVPVISKSQEFEGVQIALCSSKLEVDTFAVVFQRGITYFAPEYNLTSLS